MQPHPNAHSGVESESALTGTFEVSLTRAVLPLRDGSDGSPPGGRIQDIGFGVVVDGSDPVRADVIDLGSAEYRVVDLSGPLVVMGWLYPSGLRSLCRVVADTDGNGIERARAFTFNMALRALRGAGFGPLTRATLLRIGFRDLCQDLDLHEGTAVRLLLPAGGVVRAHLDYDSVTLVVRTARSTPNLDLEAGLAEAFPGRELFRGPLRDALGAQVYHLPLEIPRTMSEARFLLGDLRRGIVRLLGRFEPERLGSLREITSTFGERDSLRTLTDLPESPRLERVVAPAPREASTGSGSVH
jgi:hypothetical protein